MTKVRVNGPTPSGGKYSIGTYMDCNHNEVDEDEADIIMIGEYDENDNMINEVVGFTGRRK